jgi:hypothetical protein
LELQPGLGFALRAQQEDSALWVESALWARQALWALWAVWALKARQARQAESAESALWAESARQAGLQRARRAGFGLSLTLRVPRLLHLRDQGWR